MDELERCDRRHFAGWELRASELRPLAGPILDSGPFSRLQRITFLGALSPRITSCRGLEEDAPPRKRFHHLDGSRRSHSLGVALIALDIVRSLRMSETAQRYAVAWGLLHDIGNWPLSHTGEYAFSRITATTTRQLRRMIVSGDRSLPVQLSLVPALVECGVDVPSLLSLFDHHSHGLPRELQDLGALIRSPLTPDALEGMWRCSSVYGLRLPAPDAVAGGFSFDLFRDVTVAAQQSRLAIAFWRGKSEIYRTCINSDAAIRWESKWAQAILRDYRQVTLPESLQLEESQVIETVRRNGLPDSPPVSKHKPPAEYFIDRQRLRGRRRNAALTSLERIFVSRIKPCH